MHHIPDFPVHSPLALLWKDATPPTNDTSRVGQMLFYINLRHLINKVRKRNSTNAVQTLLSMASTLGYTPATGWRKWYNRLRAATYVRAKNYLFPAKEEAHNCPCCNH